MCIRDRLQTVNNPMFCKEVARKEQICERLKNNKVTKIEKHPEAG